jgi:mono/diheme cytochrome c family protein
MLIHAVVVCCLGFNGVTPDGPSADIDSFEREVRPLLLARCVGCHGPKQQKGGLRLDNPEFLNRGEGDDAVVRPGDPPASALIRAVRREGGIKMPPKAKLNDDEVAILTRWVQSGAAWPKGEPARPKADVARLRQSHWSFRPVVAPPVPDVKDARWPSGDIDWFILAGLESKGLRPAPAADRRTLIRRVTFDLIGLPPTPDEVEAFVNDQSANAFAKVVDRLLASPHYGERWGRHWLDLARYADTKGYVDPDESRNSRFAFSYTYRDWVIRAFNDDMPYDSFLVRQIAADRLAHDENETRDLAALGFLTLHRDFQGAEDKVIEDRIDVLTRTTLGLSVACARCHDHKFDPIPQEDYYSLYGVFAGASVEEAPILHGPADRKALEAYNRERNKRTYAFETALELHRRAEFGPIRSPRSIERYFLAAQSKIDHGTQADPEDGGDDERPDADGTLDVFVLNRWAERLGDSVLENHPVLAPWRAFARLDAESFAHEAPLIAQEFADREGHEENRINSRVAAMLRDHPPASLAEVARSYSELLARVDAQWFKMYREARKSLADPPGRLEDDADEELWQVLHGDGAPTAISADELYERLNQKEDGETADGLRDLAEKIEEWKRDPSSPPHATALKDPDEPVAPRIFLRGNPETVGEEVPRRFLALLSSLERKPFESGTGRLELAQAIADPANPLTARVMVNRIWMHHFGRGLVRTPSDFGTRGEPPTHPELLDYLAARFVAEGWSIKKLHRAILLTNTYQQSSAPNPSAERIDPENRLVWRVDRRRLEVEAIRDSMLAMADWFDLEAARSTNRPGRYILPNLPTKPLDSAFLNAPDPFAPSGMIGGPNPSVPTAPEGGNRPFLPVERAFPTTVFDLSRLGGHPFDLAAQPLTQRRTVYALIDREAPLSLFSAFDGANPDLHTPQRHATTVPPQGLYLLNSPAVADHARAFAKRLTRERPNDPAGQVRRAFELALARSPAPSESERVLRFLKDAASLKAVGPEPIPVAWKYGYGAWDQKSMKLTGFQELPHFTGDSYQGSKEYPDSTLSYLALNAEGGHPGDSQAHSAVRRWVAQTDGDVTIDGTLAHKLEEDDKDADGVRGHILSSRIGVLGEWNVFKGEAATRIGPIPVKAGDTIDFVVDCQKNSGYDTFTWKVRVRGGETLFASADDFEGPPMTPPPPLSPLEKFAQVMLMSNEFLFVD